jgi:protein TonB
MRTIAATVLGTALLVLPAVASTMEPRNLSGIYLSSGDATISVTLKMLAPGIYRALGDSWEGVGLFDGTMYWGVFRRGRGPDLDGTHRGTLRPDGSLSLHGEFAGGKGKAFDVVWTPEPQEEGFPDLDDYVYVEELPEAVHKVPPVYPDWARAAKLEGTVLVQALVGMDGRVADTRIVKSIPGLDGAAVDAVRQWVFKPAISGGRPAAVWVAIPVRFPPS